MASDIQVISNKRAFQFQVTFDDGEVAFTEYRWLKANMVIMRTLVPKDKQRMGIGSALIKHILDYARSQNLKVIIYCPFADKYIKEHPEYQDLLATP